MTIAVDKKVRRMGAQTKRFAFLGSRNRKTPSDPTARGHGIRVLEIDESGAFSEVGAYADIANPTFLTLSPDGRTLYAVWEAVEWEDSFVSAFKVDADTGELVDLGTVRSHGRLPCHLALWDDQLAVSNFGKPAGGASAAVFRIEANGGLSEAHAVITVRSPQGNAVGHAHSVTPSRDGRFAILADLGLDCLFVFSLPFDSELPEPMAIATMPPNSGPRHCMFHPFSDRLFVVLERKAALASCRYDSDRGLIFLEQVVSALPENFAGTNTSAELLVSPDGRFVYVSNRGHDSVAIFAIDSEGRLDPIGHVSSKGAVPRNMTFLPGADMLVVSNEEGNNLTVFQRAQSSGLLTAHHTVPAMSPMKLVVS